MEYRVSATELVRKLGDVLGRIRFRGDSFLIERNGEAVARLIPLPELPAGTLGEALDAWDAGDDVDPDFADALERIGDADRLPETPWVS